MLFHADNAPVREEDARRRLALLMTKTANYVEDSSALDATCKLVKDLFFECDGSGSFQVAGLLCLDETVSSTSSSLSSKAVCLAVTRSKWLAQSHPQNPHLRRQKPLWQSRPCGNRILIRPPTASSSLTLSWRSSCLVGCCSSRTVYWSQTFLSMHSSLGEFTG